MRFPILSEEERKKRLAPLKGKVHVVIDTDTYNEVDDQFALAHHLMTPKFDVKGIVAGHFWKNPQTYGVEGTAKASYDECRGGYSDDGQPAGRSGTQL